MPTVTIKEPVTLQETAKALQDKLGSHYEVTKQGSDELKVKQSVAAIATVHLSQDGDTTTFRVHGGGLIISRLVNELGIAKRVAGTIKETLGAASDGTSQP
jgi:hypothetical protein